MLTRNDCDEIRANMQAAIYAAERAEFADTKNKQRSRAAWTKIKEDCIADVERILNAHVTYEQERAIDKD